MKQNITEGPLTKSDENLSSPQNLDHLNYPSSLNSSSKNLYRSPSSKSFQNADVHNLYKINTFQIKQNLNSTSTLPQFEDKSYGNQVFQNDDLSQFENQFDPNQNKHVGLENKTILGPIDNIQFTKKVSLENISFPEENYTQGKVLISGKYQDIATSYKNFGISYQENFQQPNIVPLNSIREESNKIEGENEEENNFLSQENLTDLQTRVLLKNPGIGDIIFQSSKHLDQIHKMLEQHRMKTINKMQVQDSFESSFSSRFQDNYQPFNSKITEGLVRSDETNFQSKMKTTDLETQSTVQDFKDKYMESNDGILSIEELQKRESKLTEGQCSELKNNYEKEFQKYQNGSQGERIDQEIEVKRDKMHKKEPIMGVEERRSRKRMNKIQEDFEKYKSYNFRQKLLTEKNKPIYQSKTLYNNNINTLKKNPNKNRIQKNTKENFAPVSQQKELNPKTHEKNFFSIDVTSQSFDHTSKKNIKTPAAATKDKGSYTKIFNDYKERRKFQSQSNKPEHEHCRERGSSKKSSENSPMSSNLINLIQEISSERPSSCKYFNESTDFLNSKKNDFLQNNSLEKKMHFIDSNALTERSSVNHYLQNIPKSDQLDYLEFKNEPNDPTDKASKDIRLTRYNDYRSVHKNAQRHSSLHHFGHESDLLKTKEKHNMENFNRSQKDFYSNKETSKGSPVLNHSLSTGFLKATLTPLNVNRKASCERPQTSRESYNPRKSQRGLRSEEAQTSQKENFQIVQPVVACLSTKNSRVTQESLLKSLKLRQEMYSRLFSKVIKSGDDKYILQNQEYPSVKDFQEILGKEPINLRQKEDETRIYNKNVKWLMSKQRKIDELQNKKLEEKMKECTFKPQLLTKGLDLKFGCDFGYNRSRERQIGSFSRNNETK